jgi:hypothetical protein
MARTPDPGDLAARYWRDGFVVLPHVFSPRECREWKAECQRVLDTVRQEARGRGDDPDGLFPGGVYVGLSRRSGLFARAAADPRVLGPLCAILGPNVEFLSDKVVFKDGREDAPSPWHQDYPYWKGPHKLSVWIALDDATEDNGCLKLVPGSHGGEMAHANVQSQQGFGNRILDVDETTAVSAPVEAGGAVIFHDLTLHASHPNRTGADRWAVITTYRDATASEPEEMAWPAAMVVAGHGR